jgi:hypothetical protein
MGYMDFSYFIVHGHCLGEGGERISRPISVPEGFSSLRVDEAQQKAQLLKSIVYRVHG